MNHIHSLFAKHITIWCMLLLSIHAINSQESMTPDPFVEILTNAINSRSPEDLDPWLAEDFSILGRTGPMAPKVLQMLITQLNDHVLSYTLLQKKPLKKGIYMEYSFEYEKFGRRVVEITMNQDLLVTKLKLIDGHVKTLGKSEKPKAKNTTGRSVLSFPVEIMNNLLFTEVMVNGAYQKFILDTGSPRTILNGAYYNRTTSISDSKGVHGNSISGLDIVTVGSMTLHGLTLENQKILTADLEHLEKSIDTPVHGIIGTDMLEAFDIVFDYTNQRITLVDPDHFETYAHQHLKNGAFYKVPFVAQRGHLPVVELTVGPHKFHVAIDSGASSNAFTTSHQERLSPYLSNMSSADLRGVSKTTTKRTKGTLDQVTLGEKNIGKVNTIFSELSHLDKPGAIKLDGIIGYDVLSAQKTVLSYKRQELLLEK